MVERKDEWFAVERWEADERKSKWRVQEEEASLDDHPRDDIGIRSGFARCADESWSKEEERCSGRRLRIREAERR